MQSRDKEKQSKPSDSYSLNRHHLFSQNKNEMPKETFIIGVPLIRYVSLDPLHKINIRF